jgi:hypothetical protein
MTNPTPGTPVPPDELIEEWDDNAHVKSLHTPTIFKLIVKQAAAWGHAQAMQEREELRELLTELAKYLEIPDMQLGIIPSKNRKLATRARAAAERLRGGGQ